MLFPFKLLKIRFGILGVGLARSAGEGTHAEQEDYEMNMECFHWFLHVETKCGVIRKHLQ